MEDVTSKEILAQDIMDMYYGAFKEENENFHDISFFERMVDDTRAELLRNEYLQAYAAMRSAAGVADLIELSSIWLKSKVVEFKEDRESGDYIADISDLKIFSFPYDQSNTAFQTLLPVKRDACTFSRITVRGLYLLKHLPKSDIQFWWVQPKSDCGYMLYADKNCCKQANLFYVSEEADEITKGAANLIKERVFHLMRMAEGKVIDTTNDSNPLTTVQTEINKEEAK